MRDARQAVELDVVLLRDLAEHAGGAAAQVVGLLEFAGELVDSAARGLYQLFDARGAIDAGFVAVFAQIGAAALLDFGEAVIERFDQQRAALRVVEQVILQIRIAAHDPDIAEHFVQHARRASGAAFGAQFGERIPSLVAEQADDDFAVGERRVVVGNFAQTRFGIGGHRSGGAVRIENLRCVHVWTTR
ncbi:hypothetical protein QF001_007845 [Paraburkholderia youngii]